jgi:hypothetical protein
LLAEAFTNEGHATLHNANSAGVFAWDDGSLAWPDHRKGPDFLYYEIMQTDAAMGALTATLELLVSYRAGLMQIAGRLPTGWRELAFRQVRVEGGFVLDGCFRHGRLEELTVRSTLGGTLRLAPELGDTWSLDGVTQQGTRLICETRAGQVSQLRRHPAYSGSPSDLD